MPTLTCPTCGHSWESIDPAYCDQCGAFVEHPSRRRVESDPETDRYWMSKYVMHLQSRIRGGRSRGQSITLGELETGVDKLRREQRKLTQSTLARTCHIGRTQLTDYLSDHPGTWKALEIRHRGVK
jgi:hypothetical protein